MRTFEEGREIMNDMTVVPFPSQYDFFISFEVPQRENTERQCFWWLVGLWAEVRAKDGIGTTAAADEAGAIPSNA